MSHPFSTEAPEKVRELPAVPPAKSHQGEGLRGILLMVLYLGLLALLVFGCYQVFRDPTQHYPYSTVDRAQVQAPAASTGGSQSANDPADSSATANGSTATVLQPVTTLAENTGVGGTDVAGFDTVVARFDGHELTNQQFIYYYWDVFYNLYDSYGSSLYAYLDMTTPFDQQMATDVESWHQYLSSMAIYTWQQTNILCAEARANNFSLSAEDKAALDASIDALDSQAVENSFANGDAYLQNLFDPCADLESYRAYNRDMVLASAYAKHLYDTIYDENYDPNAAVRYCVNVRHILIQAEDAASADSMAAARTRAEELYAQWQQDPTEDNFINMAGTHTQDPGSQTTGGLYEDVYPGQMVTNFNDWCFDGSRQPGDHGIVETEYGYHIMYFVGESEIPYEDDNSLVAQELYNAQLEELFNTSTIEDLTENAVFTQKAQ